MVYTGRAEFITTEKFYIAKPLWEDASVGINDNSIFKGNNTAIPEEYQLKYGKDFFIEEYIDGREFNLSILGGPEGVQVLPPAEILFQNFPEGKPRIVGYEAKWDEYSFEYQNTPRTFEFGENDLPLLSKLEEIAYKCWDAFNLKGYARVDFRVDSNNQPYVLEVNANPCISPDSGFYAACQRAGLSFTQVIQRIISDVN